MTKCAARQSPRKIAPTDRLKFDSRSWRWTNTAVKPAVTSSDAGTSAISSRLRALIPGLQSGLACESHSLELSPFERANEAVRVVARAHRVVQQLLAARARDLAGRHARDVVRRVEMDAQRQLVGQALEDGDVRIVVGPHEVDGLRGQVQ